jgi:hypothetical protein
MYESDVTKWLLETIQHKDNYTLWFNNSQTFYLKNHEQLTKFVYLHTQYTQQEPIPVPRGLSRGSVAAHLLGL